jgi:glycyl-tRNA synthetase
MELEFFCDEKSSEEWFDFWREFCFKFLIDLNLDKNNLRIRVHEKQELAHYSKATCDLEYKFPFGWGELWGVAHRGCFDLSQHEKFSRQDMSYFDETSNQKFIPNCIEPSLGVDRLMLAILCDAYHEEIIDSNNQETRVILKLNKFLAPIKLAILPLSKKLNTQALKIYDSLKKYFICDFDDSGSIGKRYRRQDEIGTPFCLTYDFDSQEDSCVTIRERDSMSQSRIKIQELKNFLEQELFF